MDALIEVKIQPVSKRYYNDTTNWGVFSCRIHEDSKDVSSELHTNTDGTITVTGTMPDLESDATYIAKLKETNNKKFGKQYEVVFIYEEIDNSVEGQLSYLQSILAPTHYEAIANAYEGQDIIGLFKEDQIDISKLKGIGEKTYESIKKKVLDNVYMREALSELKQYQLTYNQIKKLVDIVGSPSLLVSTIKNNPYILTNLHGFGFKKVDQIALASGIDPDSNYRKEYAVIYVLKEQASSKGHCWMPKNDLIKEVVKLTELKKESIKDFLENMDDEVNNKFYIDGSRIALYSYYKKEKAIAEKIIKLLNSKSKVKVDDLEKKIAEAEKEQGFNYTDEQRKAIVTIAEKNMMILTGRAGAGKSTSLRGIVSIFKDKYSIGQCALAGKAAKRMEETSGLPASTIHRLLGYTPTLGFGFNEYYPLPHDVLIVDEMSMVDVDLFYHLIKAVKEGTKVVVLGDTEQLPSIGAGALLRDMINSEKIPHVSLTKIQRQSEKSGILTIANKIRDGIKVISKTDMVAKRFGELKDMFYIPRNIEEDVFNDIVSLCKRYKGDVMDLQVIAPMKSRGVVCVDKLNKALQDIFNPHDGKSDVLKFGSVEYRVGDKVIQHKNDYDNYVFNGTMGVVKAITKNKDEEGKERKGLLIDFGDGVLVDYYEPEKLSSITHAYAISVHKSQGSEAKFVILGITYSSFILLSRQLLYTAITRAKQKLFLCCQPKAVYTGIGKSLSNNRNTFLNEFLTK